MRTKYTLMIAVIALAGALTVGGWALLTRDAGSERDARTGSTPSAGPGSTATPSVVPTEDVLSPEGVIEKFAVPEGAVNPLKGREYCDTVRLLAIYARQGYGLDQQLGVVSGKKFARRLHVIAATYQRLAKQAPAAPHTDAAGAAWRALAVATRSAEEKLQVTGLQVQSQAMILELAELAEVARTELPRATATLQAACGFSPSVFALRG